MAMFLLAPGTLRCLEENNAALVPIELDSAVKDDKDDYCSEEGNGAWIRDFLCALSEFVTDHIGVRFQFDDESCINQETFDEIPCPQLRAELIRFANKHYVEFKSERFECADSAEAADHAYNHCCDDCEDGWDITYSEYDGPSPDDVDEDEPEDSDNEEELAAIRNRNAQRQRERDAAIRERDDFEPDVENRDFVCNEHCDSYFSSFDEYMESNTNSDTRWLKRVLLEFMGIDVSAAPLIGWAEITQARERLFGPVRAQFVGSDIYAQLELALPRTEERVPIIATTPVTYTPGVFTTTATTTMTGWHVWT